MMFEGQGTDYACSKLAEKIKKELSLTFRNKGINISKVQIDFKSNKLNLEFGLNEKRHGAGSHMG